MSAVPQGATRDGKVCGSLKKRGQRPAGHEDDCVCRECRCQKTAGWGTDHNGVGRCKLHGGASRIEHGGYRNFVPDRVRELAEEFASLPDPLDMLPEISLARALVADYIGRFSAFKEALLAWYEAGRKGEQAPRPIQYLDLSGAVHLLDRITRMIERMERVRTMDVIARAEAVQAHTQLIEAMIRWNNLTDPKERLVRFREESDKVRGRLVGYVDNREVA